MALLNRIGPGLVLAATGIGVGDIVATATAGSRAGIGLLWAVLAGCVLKYLLSEGIARWQLLSGATVFEGWVRHFGAWLGYVFLAYLVVWSWVAGGAVLAACALCAHALVPALGVPAWGILHSVVAMACVGRFGYRGLERVMAVFVGVMFLTVCSCALVLAPPWSVAGEAVRAAAWPAGGTGLVLSVLGGVGGSLTLLSYGYWLRERRWEGPGFIARVRVDLAVTYLVTFCFGACSLLLAAKVLRPAHVLVAGDTGALRLASMVEPWLGRGGRWACLVGFWAAAASSLLGTWQSVPYLFCDFIAARRKASPEERARIVATASPHYRGFLLYLGLAPISLLFVGEPVSVVLVFTRVGSCFLPLLAATLVVLLIRTKSIGSVAFRRPATDL